jgi:arylsulfatase A-like enzyme
MHRPIHPAVAAIILLVSLLLSVDGASSASAAPPNIVFIYADDLGYGDVSANGARAGLTPNIDRLAREGLNFSEAHATSATAHRRAMRF